MNKREIIIEKYPEDEFSFADGFDDAILGVDDDKMVIVYSSKKALEIIFNGISESEVELTNEDIESGYTVDGKKMEIANEQFQFNVKGTKGKGLPVWIDDEF